MPYVSYRPPESRFWPKVDQRGPSECWPWTGATRDGGYGAFYLGPRSTPRQVPAHRYAWELTYGAIAPGLVVMHSCDNPPCCNPAHLSLGTHADNMRDAWDKGRMRSPTTRPGFVPQAQCRRGHPMDAENSTYEPDGKRRCRTCRNDAARRRRAAS